MAKAVCNGWQCVCPIVVGALILHGLHTEQNTDLAIVWWQQAAENDDADGQYKLATALINRSANDQDIEMASELLLTAWGKGHQQAGDLLVSLGHDLPQSVTEGSETDESPITTVTDTSDRKIATAEIAPGGINSDFASNASNITGNDGKSPAIDNVSQQDDWIFSQPPNNYTIQLASFSDPTARGLFLQRNNLQGNAQLKTIRSADDHWTYVLLGTYANNEAAIQQAEMFSNKLQPWVRSFASIQRNRCAQLKIVTLDRHAKHCQNLN
jgi:hypothetical protein